MAQNATEAKIELRERMKEDRKWAVEQIAIALRGTSVPYGMHHILTSNAEALVDYINQESS